VGDASELTRSHYKLQTALFSSDTNAQVTTSVTPEPGTLALLICSGGLAFVVRRWHKSFAER
jgi:hypothetical protein